MDHGGVCVDERGDDKLPMPEIDQMLRMTPGVYRDKFEFVGFSPFPMGTIMCTNVLVPYADCLLGSEECRHGSGWDCEEVVAGSRLAKVPEDD